MSQDNALNGTAIVGFSHSFVAPYAGMALADSGDIRDASGVPNSALQSVEEMAPIHLQRRWICRSRSTR